MSEARHVALPELRDIISDPVELVKGIQVLDHQGLSRLARAGNKLFADARGASPMPYKVSITLSEGTAGIRARCTCMAAQTRPFCKHAAALLVAWARQPDSFAASDHTPEGFAEPRQRKKEVKRGKVSAAELGRAGVEQVATLVRELAVAGVASVPASRVEQMRSLGENLRELRLRRLSSRTLALAQRLEESAADPAVLDPPAYTNAMTDMFLTARKLERHFGGEELEQRHVEELIGKTWRKNDRAPVEALELMEYAFYQRTTNDDFVIRESRFLDVRTGTHYSEKQILPGFIAQRTEPKKSYAGRILEDAKGSIFPGFAPHRVDLTSLGMARPLDTRALEAALEHAHADVGAALAAFQTHRKDLFAPDHFPLAVRVSTVLATGRRAQIVDAQDRALFLPDDRALFDRLAAALENTQLRGLIGEAALQGALPTFFPSAAIVQRGERLELKSLLFGASFSGTRKVKVEEDRRRGPAPWIAAAREAGASRAAIALGEIREELASFFVTGLATLTEQAARPIVDKLEELGLKPQAELLSDLAKRPEPGERLESFVKTYTVLEVAVVRLIGAAHIDRARLVQVPLHESVFVAGLEREGELNRWESAVRLTRELEAASDEELAQRVYPAWSDGSMTPFIVHVLKKRGAAARALAEAVSAGDDQHGKTAQHTARRLLSAMETHSIAADKPRTGDKLELLKGKLMLSPRGADRIAAAQKLAELGDPAAVQALRISFAGDVSAAVRTESARALGRLHDAEIVQSLIDLLAARAEDPKEAEIALHALAELGDVRALPELTAAQAERFKPQLVARALAAIDPSTAKKKSTKKRKT